MFVSKKKYKALEKQLFDLAVNAQMAVDMLRVERATVQILRTRLEQASDNSNFTRDEINALIRLCHPDKHGNSEAATKMTQKLLAMR